MGWNLGSSGLIALGRVSYPAQRDPPFYHKPMEIESRLKRLKCSIATFGSLFKSLFLESLTVYSSFSFRFILLISASIDGGDVPPTPLFRCREAVSEKQ